VGVGRRPGLSRGWRRWGVVLLVAAVALPAATVLGKGGEAGPIDEKQTSCWPCHKDWANQKLTSFYDIVPPPEAGAAVGEEFSYVVQIQNPWLQAISHIEPTLDLSKAPSLQFAGGPDPIVGKVFPGAISLDPGQFTNPAAVGGPQAGSVVVPVPVGMTDVTLTLKPDTGSPNGPALQMQVYPGSTATGQPKAQSAKGSPGGVVTLQVGPDKILGADGLGYGNWTVKVVADTPQDLGVPSGNKVPFKVVEDARAESTGSAVLTQPQNVDIAKHSSFLLTFGLKATKDPAPGESVRLVVNATQHYDHKLASTDNYANVTKEFTQPLSVVARDGKVLVIAPKSAGFTIAQPHNGATMDTVAEAVGYATAFLLISSIWTGGMFGKASRRQLNGVFGTAKRRVAFHNFLSYGILLAASAHTVLFIVETAYYWTLGVLWGGLAILSMFGLGITGAWQVGMIRRWNYATWRWSHYGLSIAAIAFTLVHMGLDGVHFSFVQEALHWHDPLDPRKGIH
jgi:hypothetical protein